MMKELTVIGQEILKCELCPRLREYCRKIAEVKRRAYRDQKYWARPVPGFGDPKARLLIVGLAPGAHGANRTGRMFTGDKSGEFLYRALHETGFASQAESVSIGDGLVLKSAYIAASGRCAPPDNKPLREELARCRPFLEREIAALGHVRVVVALGRIAFDTYLSILRDQHKIERISAFKFAHGAEYRPFAGGPILLASYHPSQQNTSTGRLTREMLRQVFERAQLIASSAT
jgi:uracil-DNA glycosylase family 4